MLAASLPVEPSGPCGRPSCWAARAPGRPFGRLRDGERLRDLLTDRWVVEPAARLGVLDQKIAPPGALGIPGVGRHHGCNFGPLFGIDAFRTIGSGVIAPGGIGAAPFVHQRRGRDLPALAQLPHLEFRLDHGVGQEDLIERGMAVHLLELVHLDARLLHIQDEIAEALMLDGVPIRARQQQAKMGVMGARGPDLLTIDHPFAVLQVGPRRGAGEIGPAARLAEELAPGLLPGEDAFQEFPLMHVRAMRQDRRGGEHADAHLGHGDGPDARELLVHNRRHARRQAPAMPVLRPMGGAPTGLGEHCAPLDEAQIRVPVLFQI